MSDGIEIRLEDIIKRPDGSNINTGGGPADAGGFSLKNIKKQLQEVKGIFDTLQDMGFDLSKFDLNIPGLKKETQDQGQSMEKSSGLATGQQVMNFVKLLRQIYGDITINEAVDRLKNDFGGLKLSELGRKQLQ